LASKVFSLAEVRRFNRKIGRRLLTAIANPAVADNHFVSKNSHKAKRCWRRRMPDGNRQKDLLLNEISAI
jgi:predicted LPLAT superfamily acyltransferase